MPSPRALPPLPPLLGFLFWGFLGSLGGFGCGNGEPACDTADPDDTACRSSASDETGDTGTWYALDPEVSEITVTYDASSWEYTVTLEGWSGLVTLDIHGLAGDDQEWTEYHELDNRDYARNGTWDIWGRTLFVVDEVEEQQSGVSTAFAGTDEVAEALTWMVTAYDRTVAEVEDCAVWGADTAVFEGYDCREWEAR